MTPYAILLCKPSDSDETIRRLYHKHAEAHHPDVNGGAADEQWYAATSAYSAIKTEEKRFEWRQRHCLLSGLCHKCASAGVVGSRLAGGKIKVCVACGGKGRV